MKAQDLKNRFALVTFSKAVLENYNPEIIDESDDIEELKEYAETGCSDNGTVGYTIVEKKDDDLVDYYSGEEFNMPTYS